MADTKISAMPNATTPLTGAELMPLVQSGVNVKSTVSAYGDYARTKYFNHGAWQNTLAQTGSITTGTAFTYNQTDVTDGVTLSNGSRFNVPVDGVYNLQWSGQFQNTDNNINNVIVWVRVDGVDIPASAGVVSIPARKSAGIPSSLIIGWNYFLAMTAGQYMELIWLPESTLVTCPAYPASTTPAYPAAASIIATVAQVG